MKKSLLALAVMTAAGSAQAGIELYSENDVTVTMGGDIEVVYVQGKGEHDELQQQIQDSDLSFDVRYAVNESLQFGAFWEFQDRGVNEGDAYVAAYTDGHSFKVGSLCTALDDAGIGSDYQFGLTSFFSNADVYCGEQVMRYDLDAGAVYATLAARQFSDSDDRNTDASYFDGSIGYRGLENFDFTAFLGKTSDTDKGGDLHDETLWSVQARFNGVENLGLAVAYYSMDDDSQTTDTIGFAATYDLEVVALAAGVSVSDSDAAGSEDFTAWYVNAGYPLAPNTTAYVEVGADDGYTNYGTDAAPVYKENGTGFAFGVKASF